MRPQILVPLAAALAIGAGSSALAQRVIVDDDGPDMVIEDDVMMVDEDDAMMVDEYPDDEVVVRSRRRAPPVRYRERYVPPVYGWVRDRPLSCGTYHYWNGDMCVDARDKPDKE